MQLQSIKVRSAILISLALLILSGCGTNPAVYVAKGKKNLDEGKYADAEINFQKAVQKDAQLGEAWYGLGLAQFRQKKLGDAYNNLIKANDLLASREDVTVTLADVCLAGYMLNPTQSGSLYDTVVGTAKRLLEKNTNSYDGLRFQGYVAMLDRHYPDAVEELKKANAIKPAQNDVTDALVESLIKNGQGPEAEAIAQTFLQKVKNYGPVYDLLYGYYMNGNRSAQAEDLLKAKIANNPDVLDYRLQLARHYMDVQKSDQMKSMLQQVTEDSKRFPDGLLQVGNFYASANRLDEALRLFQKGVGESSGSSKVAFQQRTAEVLTQMGKPDQAVQVLESILATDGYKDNVPARSLRASIKLDSNDPTKLDSAFVEFQQLTKLAPNDAVIHYNLGRAYLAKGNTNQALQEFQNAVKYRNTYAAPRLLLASLSLQREDYKEAARYADEALALTNGNPEARLLKSASLTGLGNFEQAGAELGRLNREYPNDLAPKLQAVALKVAQKKYPEAEADYKALYASTGDPRPLAGLVSTYVANNQFDAAIAFLNQQKGKGNAAVIDDMLADAYLRGHKLDQAVQQYSKLVDSNPKDYSKHLSLGDALLQKGNTEGAVTEFQTAKSLAPKDAETNAMLALALYDAGRSKEAAQAYHETMALQSGNPLVMNNLAYLMVETGGDLSEAQRLAMDAHTQQPSNADLSDTLAWVYVKRKLTDSAIQILQNAINKNPNKPEYRYHLAVAYMDKGEKAKAREQLQEALASRPQKSEEQKIRDLLNKL